MRALCTLTTYPIHSVNPVCQVLQGSATYNNNISCLHIPLPQYRGNLPPIFCLLQANVFLSDWPYELLPQLCHRMCWINVSLPETIWKIEGNTHMLQTVKYKLRMQITSAILIPNQFYTVSYIKKYVYIHLAFWGYNMQSNPIQNP